MMLLNKLVCLFVMFPVLGATLVMGQTTAYTDVCLETVSPAGRVEQGVLVVRDGKIVDVGSDVTIPDDARIVNLSGKTLLPAIVDPYFVFDQGQQGGGDVRTVTFNGRTIQIPNRGGNSGPATFQRISEYFYPYDFDFRPALRSGILTANLVGDGQGLSALANLKKDADPEMIFQSDGFVFAKVSNQTSSLDTVRRPLGASRGGGRSNGRPGGSTGAQDSKTDPTQQAWEAVKSGERPIFVNVSNSATIAYLLKFFEDKEKIRLVLVSTGANLYELLDQFKEFKNLSVVLEPGWDQIPYSNQFTNVAKLLHDRKIPFAFSLSLSNAQLSSSQDDPLFPVAMLVKAGLDRQTALEALTRRPAEMLGLGDDCGSLEKGKQASFLVFDGDPLATGSSLERIVLKGVDINEE